MAPLPAPALRLRATATASRSGPNGPILLHDHHFIEQMAHFNRERVPERNVHAKGSGAFGVFETTEDVSQYTKAALFQKGARTEIGKRIEEAVHAGRSEDVAPHQAEADPSEVAGNPSINQG